MVVVGEKQAPRRSRCCRCCCCVQPDPLSVWMLWNGLLESVRETMIDSAWRRWQPQISAVDPLFCLRRRVLTQLLWKTTSTLSFNSGFIFFIQARAAKNTCCLCQFKSDVFFNRNLAFFSAKIVKKLNMNPIVLFMCDVYWQQVVRSILSLKKPLTAPHLCKSQLEEDKSMIIRI